MTTVRLVCRLGDDTQRRVIVSAPDFQALISTAALKLGCSKGAVIVEIKDNEDFWEIDDTYWASIQHNETLFVRSRTTARRPSTAERPVAGSSSQPPTTATAPSDTQNLPKRRAKSTSSSGTAERAAKRKKASRRSGTGDDAGNAIASDVGETSTRSASETSTTGARSTAAAPQPRKEKHKAKKRKTRDEGPQPQDVGPSTSRVALAAANPSSRKAWNLNRFALSAGGSKRSWSDKEDTILWEKLRLEIERRRSLFIPIVTQRELFETIVSDHGTNGTKTQALKGRTADSLSTHARNRVREAVDNGYPVPPELLHLFKYRTIVQPVTSSNRLQQQQRTAHQREIIHQQRAEGNRRFGMASIGTSTGSSTAASSRSSTVSYQDPRPSAAALPQPNTAPTMRNTVVVRDSSDEDEDQGNESEWQSDVPQPEDSDSASGDSDEEHAISKPSQDVQRMWGGREIPPVHLPNRGGNHWPGPPTLLPSASANNPAGSASSSTFSAAENARETQRRQAALNPFAPRQTAAANTSSRPAPMQVDAQAAPEQAASSSSAMAASSTTPRTSRPTEPHVPVTSSSTSMHSTGPDGVVTSSTISNPERPLAQTSSSHTAAIKSEPNDVDLHITADQQSPSFAINDTTTTPSPRATVKAQLPEDGDLTGQAQDVSEDELGDDDGDDGLGGSSRPLSTSRHTTAQAEPDQSTSGSITRICYLELQQVELVLSERWASVRCSTAEIVQRNVKHKSRVSGGLDLEDINYDVAAEELLSLLTALHKQYSRQLELLHLAYKAVALTIAFEVFASVAPPQWSVRRTAFAVAGYFAAVQRKYDATRRSEVPRSLPLGNSQAGLERFMRKAETAYWAIGWAADGSGYLERESNDLSSALAFVRHECSETPALLSLMLFLPASVAQTRRMGAEEGLTREASARRALDFFDKIEASRKFLSRCEIPTKQWGITPHVKGADRPWRQVANGITSALDTLTKALSQPSINGIPAQLEAVKDAYMALQTRYESLRTAGIISVRPAPSGDSSEVGARARRPPTAGPSRGSQPHQDRSANQIPVANPRWTRGDVSRPTVKTEKEANHQAHEVTNGNRTQRSASRPSPGTHRAPRNAPAITKANPPPRPPSQQVYPVNRTSRRGSRPLFEGAGSPVIGESSRGPEARPSESGPRDHQRWS